MASCSAEPIVVTRTLIGETGIASSPPLVKLSATASLAANSPTPKNTATPVPTFTARLSPPPTTPLMPPIERLFPGQTLPVNHDLLYISDGGLRLWQPKTGQVISLLSQTNDGQVVSDWQISADQQTVLITQTPRDGRSGFTLSLFDTLTRQLRPLWSDSGNYLVAFALAGNGRSAAILLSTASPLATESQQFIQVIDNQTRQISPLAHCPNSRQLGSATTGFRYTSRCLELIAVPNSEIWLWRDIEGLWQGGLAHAPQLLLPHDYFANDPPRIYKPTADWSPDGRYQLLTAQRFEGGSRWILDRETGQTFAVANSNFGLEPGAIWQWTGDNRLLLIPPPGGGTSDPIELWRIAETQLVQDATLTLPNPDAFPMIPGQLPDGRFALITNGSSPAQGTITLISEFDQPAPLPIALPPLERWDAAYRQSLTWTPDTVGAIFLLPTAGAQQPFYFFTAETTLYDLTELLGDTLSRLLWLP